MTTRNELTLIRDHAIDRAEHYLQAGVRESGGRNRGAEIDAWTKRLGLPLGQPWCLIMVLQCYYEAAQALLLQNPLPQVAHVYRFWRRVPDRWKVPIRTPSSVALGIACHVKDTADPYSPGHCGIVTGGGSAGVLTIEGNTNDEGSREGDRVAHKLRDAKYWNLGVIDIGRDA